jgi:hypothetical protein
MATYVDEQYGRLTDRKNRVVAFFGDLDSRLATISAPTTYHQDIYWDGGFVRITANDSKLASETPENQLKYYNQGLGLLKLAINKTIYV